MNTTKRDKEAMRALGRKGGLATKEQHGKKHFSKIGRKGAMVQIKKDAQA